MIDKPLITSIDDIKNQSNNEIVQNIQAIITIDNTKEEYRYPKLISKINFYYTEFKDCSFKDVVFLDCSFIDCKFVNCKGIVDLTFTNCKMENCNIESLVSIRNHDYENGINLNGCLFRNCKFGKETNLYDYLLDHATFIVCDMPYKMYIIGDERHPNYIFPEQNKACGIVTKHLDPDGKRFKILKPCARIEELDIMYDIRLLAAKYE